MKMAERDTIENAKNDLNALSVLVGSIYKLDDPSEVDIVCPYLERCIADVSDSLYELMTNTTVDEQTIFLKD